MNKIISMPLLKENIKRFWGFGFVSFLSYFLCTNFVLLLDDTITDDIILSLTGSAFFGYVFFNILLPVIAATIMFSYLAKVNCTTAMHTMPFSRLSLFVTNYLSGIILVLIPMFINSALMIGLRDVYLTKAMSASAARILTMHAVLHTSLWNAVVIFFSYSIAVLGTMVSGTGIIQFLTAGAFNALAPVLWLSIQGYAAMYIYGYNFEDSVWYTIAKMHPAVYGITTSVSFGRMVKGNYQHILSKAVIVYIIIAIIISVLAYIAYKYRKLETAGDPYVFKFMKYFITFLFTFLPATLGLLFVYDGNANPWLSIGIAAIVGFVIGWMIVNKTFRIFNKEGIITFVACMAVIGAIIAACSFDILGLEKKVPKLEDVKFVSYYCPYVGNEHNDVYLYDKENIDNIRSFHKQIIDAKDNKEIKDVQTMEINYYLNNGKVFSRYYSFVPSEMIKSSENLKSIFESGEVNNIVNELKIFDAEKTDITISSNTTEFGLSFDNELSSEDKQNILNALIKDFNERTFEESVAHKFAYARINFAMDLTSEEFYSNNYDQLTYVDNYEIYENNKIRVYVDIEFNDDYENLVEILKDLKIYDQIMPNEHYGYIEILLPYSVVLDNQERVLLTVTDTELQREIITKAAYAYDVYIPEEDKLAINCVSYGGYDGVIDRSETYCIAYTDVDYNMLPESVKEELSKLKY